LNVFGIIKMIGIVFILILTVMVSNKVQEAYENEHRCCHCVCFHYNDSQAIDIKKLDNGDCLCKLGNNTFIA